MTFVGRKRLHHSAPPNFTCDDGPARYLITLCCRNRQTNQLATPLVWASLCETLAFRTADGSLICPLLLAMPDHLHAIMGFPSGSMEKTIAALKSWLARRHQISWQRGFFDHRLRSLESAAEKRDYILQNPVRAGLIDHPQQWPYLWDPQASSDRPQRPAVKRPTK